jgi:ubiquinone/menaquinone biosynthesis C-methylase UbiE
LPRDASDVKCGVKCPTSECKRPRRCASAGDDNGNDVQLDQGFANALSYEDASFDRVFSSFMYHHLDAQQQVAMLSEVRRVLKPGGRFELVDFAGREHVGHGGYRNWIHSHERLAGNTESNVTTLLQRSGFADVRVVGRHAKFFWTVIHYQASQA